MEKVLIARKLQIFPKDSEDSNKSQMILNPKTQFKKGSNKRKKEILNSKVKSTLY